VRWLAACAFASCNYLGLDLEREVIEAILAYLDRWGTHPSWSRMLGSPALYRQIETRLSCSTTAPTSPSPSTRACPGRRSGSASR
jgi:8-amino-7-oxononanoate synthase